MYQKEALNNWDYSEDNWAETDNDQYTDISNFGSSEIASAILSNGSFHSMRDDFFWQPKKEENDFQSQKKVMTKFDILKSDLLKPLEDIFQVQK